MYNCQSNLLTKLEDFSLAVTILQLHQCLEATCTVFNDPWPAEFLKCGIIPLPCFEYNQLSFKGYQDKNLKLVSQQYRAWSDCTDVSRLITISSSREKVKFIGLLLWYLYSVTASAKWIHSNHITEIVTTEINKLTMYISISHPNHKNFYCSQKYNIQKDISTQWIAQFLWQYSLIYFLERTSYIFCTSSIQRLIQVTNKETIIWQSNWGCNHFLSCNI